MSVQYKLYSVDGRGAVGVIRKIFHVVGVQYKDITLTKSQWEKQYKSKVPFGSLPFLDVTENGVTTRISQTHAIGRFLARRYGLNGDSPDEEVYVEMVADCVQDYVMCMANRVLHEQNERKKIYLDLYRNERLPEALQLLNQQLELNNGGDGFFIGSGLTWCDIVFVHWMDWLPEGLYGTIPPLDDYPKLRRLYDRIWAHPKMAEWKKLDRLSSA